MRTSFGDVLDLWGAARLISAAATRGDGLGMSTRLACAAPAPPPPLFLTDVPDNVPGAAVAADSSSSRGSGGLSGSVRWDY